MTADEIIRMAREAGYGLSLSDMHAPALTRFAALVAAHEREKCEDLWKALDMKDEQVADSIKAAVDAEREACAKVAEETVCDVHLPTGVKIYGSRAGKAIRARGQQ